MYLLQLINQYPYDPMPSTQMNGIDTNSTMNRDNFEAAIETDDPETWDDLDSVYEDAVVRKHATSNSEHGNVAADNNTLKRALSDSNI